MSKIPRSTIRGVLEQAIAGNGALRRVERTENCGVLQGCNASKANS
jgi:hypothetical protein